MSAERVTDPGLLPRGPKTFVTAAGRAGWEWRAMANGRSVVVRVAGGGSRGVAYWSGGETKLKLHGCWAWTDDSNPARVSMTDLKGMMAGD